MGLAFNFIKLVPAIIALVGMGGLLGTYEKAANGNCGAEDDKLTARTFSDLDEELQASNSNLTTQVVLDVLSIVVEALMTAAAFMSSVRALWPCSSQ